jgi:uncharacterized membrane protein
MGNSFYEILQYLWDNHRGKVVGLALGLVVGLFFILVGFWKTLLVVICVIGGYFLGKRIDEGGNSGDWWER